MRFLRKIKTFFKVIAFLVLLTVLAAAGFAAGIYFELIDSEKTQQVNEALSLYKMPFVGQYFDVPEGVEWTPEDTEAATNALIDTITTGLDTGVTAVTDVAEQIMKPEPEPEPPKSKEVKISQKEIEKQMQEREAAEKKRISKLARVYASMKADVAAEALGNLDADMAVLLLQKMEDDSAAQILAKMDPVVAAQLTQMMFTGVPQRGPSAQEIRRALEAQRAAEASESESAVESAYIDDGDWFDEEEEWVDEGEYVEGEYVEEPAEEY